MNDDEPMVPPGVLRGIKDLAEGRTATDEDIDAALKFGDTGYSGRPLDTEHGCPWCLAPRDSFHETDMGEVGCQLCMAVQPTDQLWYQAGEKIIDLHRASEMYQVRWRELFE